MAWYSVWNALHVVLLGAGVKPGLQLQNDNDWLPVPIVLDCAGQLSHAAEPAPAYVFFAHIVQASTLTAAIAAEALPAAQFVHVAVPVVGLYLPAVQATHVSETGSRYPMTCMLFMTMIVSAPLMTYKYCPCSACEHVTCKLG